MVWIYYCVSMGCGFHFYKVNLFIAAYHRIKVSVKKKKVTEKYYMSKCGFTHLHLAVSESSGDNQAPKPLWKAMQSSGPDLGCVSGLSGSISNLLMSGLHF